MMVRLGDVCAISASAKENPDEYVWLLNLDMVEQQTGRVLQYVYVPKEEAVGSVIRFDTDNVLYSKLRPNLNKVVLPTKDGFATSELLPLRPDTTILCKEYLATYLRSGIFVTWAVSKATGAKMPRLASKELLNKAIPLPSLAEQKRIASVIEAIDNLISLRKRQLAKLDELVKARFAEMFSGQYPEIVLGDEIETTSGGTPSRKKTEYFDGGTIPWMTSGEVNQGIISHVKGFIKGFITQEGLANSSAKWIPAESVVIAMYGATVGTVGILRIPTTTNQAVCSLLPNSNFNPFYLYYAVKQKRDWMIASTMGAAQPNISQAIIQTMKIAKPPMDMQKRFSAFVEEAEKMRLTVRQGLDKMEMLKRALMQEYFGGSEL